MSGNLSVPISEILRSKASSENPLLEDEPKKKSREDWRKAKELEEARKVFINVLKNVSRFINILTIFI